MSRRVSLLSGMFLVGMFSLFVSACGEKGGSYTTSNQRGPRIRREDPDAAADRCATVATVTVEQVTGSAALDTSRPNEAFRITGISSMRASPSLWDCSAAVVSGTQFSIPASGWIVTPTPNVTTFGLIGGRSAWKNAPDFEVVVNAPFVVSGWKTANPSVDPNMDDVMVWAASTRIERSWSYTVTAR